MANRRRGEIPLAWVDAVTPSASPRGAGRAGGGLRAEDLAGLAGASPPADPGPAISSPFSAQPCAAAAMTFRTRRSPPAPRG